jgi:poly(3-hydroxybutyrate) depolymerase
MRSFLLTALAMAFVTALPSASCADDTIVARLAADTGLPYSYGEYLPPGYDAEPDDAFHPLVVFMHGTGERAPFAADADTIIRQSTVHGPLSQIAHGERRFADAGAVVIAPNCSNEDGWWDDGKLHTFFAYLVSHYRIDWRRVYVTGISMGGGGTFIVGNRHGPRAAAYIPICPAGEANGAPYAETPVWGFHAVADGTVNIGSTWNSFDRIADARAGRDVDGPSASYPADGADHTAIFDQATGTFTWVAGRDGSGSSPLRATIYPDGSHNSWTRSYDDPAVWTWLFAQQRAIPDGLPEDTIFVDSIHPGVTLAGDWSRHDDTAGYFFWDLATATAGDGVEAIFPLRAREDGRHEIFLRHAAVAGATRAEVVIAHDAGEERIEVDLSMSGGAFASLGTFPLRASGAATLTLHGASGATGTLVADAVAIVRRGPLDVVDAGMPEGDASVPMGDAGPRTDGAVPPGDGGVRDAGVSRSDAGAGSDGLVGSCACSASAPSPLPLSGCLALAGVALVAARRRHRRGE